MVSVKVTVKSNRLSQMPAAAKRGVAKGFAQVRPTVLAESQRRTPVDSGGLRASETVESDDNSLTLTAGAGLPDARAVFVHQGTRRMAARPYLRDAIEASVPAITNAIESGIRSEMK